MLLAADVGNTQTVLGLYDGERLADHWRLATDVTRTGDELSVLLGGLLDPDAVDAICLSTTVPMLLREWELLAGRWAHAPLLAIGPGVRTGIPIRYDDPREVGPDRIVNSVAAKRRFGAPVIVVDFGTSTNFDVVSPAGEYIGGVLAPGIETSMDALFARAARLVRVEYIEPPRPPSRASSPASSTGSRARWTGSWRRSAGSSRRPTPPWSQQAGSQSSSRRTRRRSSTWIRSSRSTAFAWSGS